MTTAIHIDHLLQVVAAEQQRLAHDPNVIGVGFGPKMQGDQQVPGVAIRYAVRAKIADPALREQLGTLDIAPTVEGFVTDVFVPVVARPAAAPTGERGGRKEEPLVGGTSTTVLSDWHSFPTGYGTLGGICFDLASGDAMAISNAHVWGEDTGNDVIQPWLPVDEYLEASVKWLTCGPIIAYLGTTTLPRPLTLGLAAGSGAAASVAFASDQEDPSRWGQRVTAVAPGSKTIAESIRIDAEVPSHPLPGLPYSMKTRWDYTRITDQADAQASVTEDRPNQHTLLGKRVWTNRQQFRGGERVQICAQIRTSADRRAEDYFVIAQCFPHLNKDAVRFRSLLPGRCEIEAKGRECLGGFDHTWYAHSNGTVNFPVARGTFRFESTHASRIVNVTLDGAGGATPALRIPLSGMTIRFAPAQRAIVTVSHSARPVEALALDPLGRVVARAASGPDQRKAFQLDLKGPHITAVRVVGGGGEGYVHDICIDRVWSETWSKGKGRVHTYEGFLDLDLREVAGRWGIELQVQTLDNLPVGGDPIAAAQNIGGIVASASLAQLAPCLLVLALDEVFDVF